MGDNEGLTNRSACASCKHQRKKCPERCILAPHFPPCRTEEFLAVHKIFGIANVTRTIKPLNFVQQQEAINSFIWEATTWIQDPVHGPFRHVKRLEDKIKLLEQEKKQQQAVIQDMAQHFLLRCDNGMVDFSHDNGNLISDSSAMNANNNNASFLEEREGNGICRIIQGRGIQGINPSFNYDGSFVQEEERERGSSSAGIYSSFGQGRGRGYYDGGVWWSSGGDGQVRVMNQGTAQNNCIGAERLRVFGDGMQYPGAACSPLLDYSQHNYLRNTNQNNNLPAIRDILIGSPQNVSSQSEQDYIR